MLFLLRKRPVKTLKHLPKFLPRDDDFKNTALIADEQHEKLRLTLLDVKNQFFVETATWGLADWERVLALSVKEDATIQDRRNQILLRLQSNNTVSNTFMNNLINMFCEDKTGYIVEHNSDYCFEICTSSDDKIKWKDLLEAVNLYKPAHLGFYVIIKIESRIDVKHKANIIQYVNSKHNFWNLGTAEKTYWDGVWCWDGTIDWSGIKPDAKYKERQSHIADILTKVNSIQLFNIKHNADITYKIASKHNILTKHKLNNIFSVNIDLKQNIKNKVLNTNINSIKQSRTEITKNLLNGSFCWDGTHELSGSYKPNTNFENICTFYSTDINGNMKKGTFEIL